MGSVEVFASGGSFDVPQVNDQYGNYKKEVPPQKEKGFLDSITEPLSEVWDYVVDVASDFWDWFVGILAKITEVVVDTLSAVLDWIVENGLIIGLALVVIILAIFGIYLIALGAAGAVLVIGSIEISASLATLIGTGILIGELISGLSSLLSGNDFMSVEMLTDMIIGGISGGIGALVGWFAGSSIANTGFVSWISSKIPWLGRAFPVIFGGSVGGGVDQTIFDLFKTGKINIKNTVVAAAFGAFFSFAGWSIWNHSDSIVSAINKFNPFSKTQSVATKAAPKSCFTAGTLIQTEEGAKPIEKLRVGDQVLSKDEKTGKIGYKEVKHFFQREVDEIYEIYVNGKKIETTTEHPFWVEGKGWTKVKDLRVGDLLVTSEGERLPIEKIIRKQKHTVVYNIEVEGYHTYFVSDLHIFVHNKLKLNLQAFGSRDGKILNIGSGRNPLKSKDAVNLDIEQYVDDAGNPLVDVIADAEKRIPFPDNHFDEIIAQNPMYNVGSSEINRVLKPGGTLKIVGNYANKNFKPLWNAIEKGDMDYFRKLGYKVKGHYDYVIDDLNFGTFRQTGGKPINPNTLKTIILEKIN